LEASINALNIYSICTMYMQGTHVRPMITGCLFSSSSSLSTWFRPAPVHPSSLQLH